MNNKLGESDTVTGYFFHFFFTIEFLRHQKSLRRKPPKMISDIWAFPDATHIIVKLPFLVFKDQSQIVSTHLVYLVFSFVSLPATP